LSGTEKGSLYVLAAHFLYAHMRARYDGPFKPAKGYCSSCGASRCSCHSSSSFSYCASCCSRCARSARYFSIAARISAVSFALAASEGVLVDLERVAEDALRDRGNERVVLVIERVFGLDDMRGKQHLELLGLGEGGQRVLPLDGRQRRPGRFKLRFHGLDDRVKAGLRGGDGRDRRIAVKPVDCHRAAPRGEAVIRQGI